MIQRTESVERIGCFVADVRVGIAKGDIQGTYCARISRLLISTRGILVHEEI